MVMPELIEITNAEGRVSHLMDLSLHVDEFCANCVIMNQSSIVDIA